jgi:aspartate kinase
VHPDSIGTVVAAHSPRPKSTIKSVAYDTDIALLKVHAAGVGARPGVLSRIANQVTERGINIKSVVTSQTCISLLLARNDLEAARSALKNLKPRPYQRIDKLDKVALVAIVGEDLIHRRGIAVRCLNAVAQHNVDVEMISFGSSRAALYFVVRNSDVPSAVKAIHSTFFVPGRK